ncbi:MAG: hypothetical protein M4579_002440 [Chaenotheca gracillima]|nr:MAG: hypothetical protein M4579_002440 [Chaenotheca gracillima]
MAVATSKSRQHPVPPPRAWPMASVGLSRNCTLIMVVMRATSAEAENVPQAVRKSVEYWIETSLALILI